MEELIEKVDQEPEPTNVTNPMDGMTGSASHTAELDISACPLDCGEVDVGQVHIGESERFIGPTEFVNLDSKRAGDKTYERTVERICKETG